MKSFAVYDNINGIVVLPNDSTVISADEFKITESSALYYDDPADSFCNIYREYIINSDKVYLDVSYEFTRDVYLYLSYTCMLPVPADITDSVSVYYDNGTLQNILIPKTAESSDKIVEYTGFASRAVGINGSTSENKKFSILTEVYTAEDSADNFNSVFKTSVYDYKSAGVKLYFGKFDEYNRVLVPKGTCWNTSCSWSLSET